MIVFPQVGDVGLEMILVVTKNGVPQDISPATDLKMIFRAPDGRSKTFDATFKTNGEDGKVAYTTQADTDLDVHGEWEAQVSLSLGSFVGYTSTVLMPVRKNANRPS